MSYTTNLNKIGETNAIYCKQHAFVDMVNVISKTCIYPGCHTIPTFNKIGETKAIYCKQHALCRIWLTLKHENMYLSRMSYKTKI